MGIASILLKDLVSGGLGGGNYQSPAPIQTPGSNKENDSNTLALALIAILILALGTGIYFLSKK